VEVSRQAGNAVGSPAVQQGMATLFLLLMLLVTGATSTPQTPSWIPDGADAISAGCAARLQARPGLRQPARAEVPAICRIGEAGSLIGKEGAYERARGSCRVPLRGWGSGIGAAGAASTDSREGIVATDCAHVPVQPGRIGR
jgi:hypothetical protein